MGGGKGGGAKDVLLPSEGFGVKIGSTWCWCEQFNVWLKHNSILQKSDVFTGKYTSGNAKR